MCVQPKTEKQRENGDRYKRRSTKKKNRKNRGKTTIRIKAITETRTGKQERIAPKASKTAIVTETKSSRT